jgi:hypothetical protein
MSNLPNNNFNRNSFILKDYNPNAFVDNEVYATDIFVKPEDVNESTVKEFSGDDFTANKFTINDAKDPAQPEQTWLGTALKLPNRVSDQPLSKYVVGLMCVVTVIAAAAYPIAMNRVSQNGKFAESYVKSLTREYKPAQYGSD